MSVASSNNFCSACGNALLSTAVVCPRCGSPTSNYSQNPSSLGKSKTTAVVLAVFLGPWAWLYTYRKNAAKFWITIVTSTLLFALGVVQVILYAYAVEYSYASSSQVLMGNITIWTLWAVNFAFWLWCLIDNANKSQTFFENYSGKR